MNTDKYLRKAEHDHEEAAYAEFDRRTEEADRQQAMIDELVDQMWSDSDIVEDELTLNSDVVTSIVIKNNIGAISDQEAGERLLSSAHHWLTNRAERELGL